MASAKVEGYRQKAAELRAMAAREHDSRLKAELLWIAEEYDNLAKEAEDLLLPKGN